MEVGPKDRKLFTPKEMDGLAIKPFVKSVSQKGITHTDEIFVAQTTEGEFPIEIF